MSELTLPADLRLSVLPPKALVAASGRSLNDYEARLSEIQRFRGRVYFADGAISSDALDSDGKHHTDFDYQNWHLFVTTPNDAICACFRLCMHEANAASSDLKIWEVVQRMRPEDALRYSIALENFIRQAASERVRVGEVGGWAVGETARGCAAAMTLPFAAWSLYQIIGSALVLSAATARHKSASILRKIGGFSLSHLGSPLPKFYDASYRCEMEFICYDSRKPAPKYESLVAQIRAYLLPLVSVDGAQNGKPISGHPRD